MKKMMKGSVLICSLILAACGGDEGTNNGQTANNGGMTSNNGGMTSNNGGMTSNNGGMTSNNGGMTSNNGAGLTTGADCAITDVCDGGYCKPKAADVCDGTCTDYVATGDECGAMGVCNFATDACDTSVMPNLCITKVAKGGDCAIGTCETGLFCKKAMAADPKGVCSDPIAVDMPCPSFFGCEAGLYCDATDPTMPVCKATTLELDDDCEATPLACKTPNFCDVAGTKKCKALETATCD